MSIVRQKLDELYIRLRYGWRGLVENEDGMEVIQVIVLLAVGMAVIAAVAALVWNLMHQSEDSINDSLNQAIGG